MPSTWPTSNPFTLAGASHRLSSRAARKAVILPGEHPQVAAAGE